MRKKKNIQSSGKKEKAYQQLPEVGGLVKQLKTNFVFYELKQNWHRVKTCLTASQCDSQMLSSTKIHFFSPPQG